MQTKIEELAEAAFHRNGLQVRILVQELLRENVALKEISPPDTNDRRLLAIAASLIELLAARQNQAPPPWTKEIGPMPEPFFLLESASHLKRLRALCENESPQPMRKRYLYAPPNYLEFA